MIFYTYMQSPVGRLFLARSEAGLCLISFPKSRKPTRPEPEWVENNALFNELIQQLDAYFAGELKQFSLQPDLSETTPFQQTVLAALRKVPYGETVSYGELARRIGNPKASRAVGMVNARNPIPIVIPCHRVIGSDGSLTGFGGGLEVKQALLDLERRHC